MVDQFEGKRGPRKTKPRKSRTTHMDRWQPFLDGERSFDELEDEEVSRGQLRSSDGTFKGRKSERVPLKLHELLRQEQIRRFNEKVAETLQPSLQTLHDISRGRTKRGGTPADARLKAAIYLIERTVGKVPEKTEMQVEVKPWQENIEGLLYNPGKEASDAD